MSGQLQVSMLCGREKSLASSIQPAVQFSRYMEYTIPAPNGRYLLVNANKSKATYFYTSFTSQGNIAYSTVIRTQISLVSGGLVGDSAMY
jgi:hypothetical protein